MRVVRIMLDCGHTRTWNADAPAKFYGPRQAAKCKECDKPELITSIMKKAAQA